MRAILAILLAAPLVAAGCFEAPAEEVSTASAGSGGANAQAGATAPAGETAATSAEDAAAARTTVPFSAEGNTFNGFAVCLPGQGCTGSGLPGTGDGESWFEVDLKGALQDAELTLTWDATTPATDELLLGIAYENAEGESDWVTVTGASPLDMSEKALGIPAANVHGVYVNAFKCEAAACTSYEQAFAIEGTLTTSAQ